MTQTLTDDLLESVQEVAPDVVHLATAVSLASRIEPALLRRARLEVWPGMDAGVELELWHSPLTQARSPQAMTLRPDVANRLQLELHDIGKLDQTYRIVAECHRGLSEAIRIEEEITWLALGNEVGSEDKVKHLLRAAVNTLVEGDQPDLAFWVARFLPRAPASVRDLPEAWLLSLTASSRLGGVRVLPGDSPHDLRQEEVFWALANADKDGTLYLGRDGTDLLISLAPPDNPVAATGIPIPLTDPILIELRHGIQPNRELHRIDPTSTETVRLPLKAPKVQLRTAAGEVYTIAVPTDQGKKITGSPPEPAADPVEALTGLGGEPLVDRAELRRILGDFLRPEGSRIAVIQGPRGSGKSYTWPFVERVAGASEGVRAAYVTASQAVGPPLRAEIVVRQIAARMGLADPPPSEPDEHEVRAVHRLAGWLIDAIGGLTDTWLLAIDGLDEEATQPDAAELIEELATSVHDGRVRNLRLVLIGNMNLLPASIDRFVTREVLAGLSASSIRAHLLRVAENSRALLEDGVLERIEEAVLHELDPPFVGRSLEELNSRIRQATELIAEAEPGQVLGSSDWDKVVAHAISGAMSVDATETSQAGTSRSFWLISNSDRIAVTPSTAQRQAFRADAIQVTMYSVGDGEAIVVSRGGHAILVDGGADDSRKRNDELGEKLAARLDVRSLCAIVSSHPHQHHTNSYAVLFEKHENRFDFTCDYFDNATPGADSTFQRLEQAQSNLPVVRQPVEDQPAQDSQSRIPRLDADADAFLLRASTSATTVDAKRYWSIFMLLRFRDAWMLFTGDAYKSYEKALLRRVAAVMDQAPRIHLLKVTHHGSSVGTSQELVDALDPAIAIVSTADVKGWQLENDVRERLNRCAIYATFDSARPVHKEKDIIVRTDGRVRNIDGMSGILFEVLRRQPDAEALLVGAATVAQPG